jgi:ornithine lipid hydroxylase
LPANDSAHSRHDIVAWLLWPGLLAGSLAITGHGFRTGSPVLYFTLAYLLQAVCLYALEQTRYHESAWNEDDGQTFANVAHTLLNKGTAQILIVFSSAIGIAAVITPMTEPGYGVWPRQWPMWLQASLGLVAAEFGLYWAHRLAHEFPVLWRFHAIHHSVTRLWIVNTGRFHFIDSLLKIAAGLGVLLLLGAPMEVIMWLSAITAFIGMLTHCNVRMRFGPLSWIFNTPEIHRWHHSRDLREGNKNYGENLVVWDVLFGTYFNQPWRRPPVDIGIDEAVPRGFLDQLAWPFRRAGRRSASQ